MELKGKAHLRVGDNGVFNGAPDVLMYGLFHSQSYEASGTDVMNLGPELDKLIEAGRQTRDREKKIKNYTAAQKMFMDKAVIVPLYYEKYIVGSFHDVTGIHTPPIQQMVKWESLRHKDM